MRRIIAFEGKLMYPQDVWIEPGAIEMVDHMIPISYHDRVGFPYGFATEFERDVESGEVTVEITIFALPTDRQAAEFHELYSPSFYLTDIMFGEPQKNGARTLVYGRLRSIAMVPNESAGSWK